MRPRYWQSVLAAVIIGTTVPTARAAESEWQRTLVIYLMGAAIDGEQQFGDLTVPVDLSVSDVFSALEFGAMGAYRADNGTWSATVDTTFVALGGHAATERGIVTGDLDVDQFTLMGTVGRRISPTLEALFTLSYIKMSTDVDVTIRNPLTEELYTRNFREDASWVDPMIGLAWNVPIGEKWRFNLRGDVGGFGIGSDLSYQLLANFRWQANERFGVVFGYRIIGFDYDDGSGANYERYDLTEQGPLAGLTISF